MPDWWSDLERDVLDCLEPAGVTPPEELSRRLNLSEAAATSLVAMLARDGKLRISAVEPADQRPDGPALTPAGTGHGELALKVADPPGERVAFGPQRIGLLLVQG